MRNEELDRQIMSVALELAREAGEADEVPVGAVVVKNGEIIGKGKNKRETKGLATAHAEIEAINAACKALGGWNLHDCDLYVTLEPCPMCAGAVINARIANVIIGATDSKAGAFGGKFNLADMGLNHKPEIFRGVLAEDCSLLLSDFFKGKRQRGARWTAKD